MPAMKTKRPYYRTKAEWAAATAARLRADAREMHTQRIPGSNWRGVRSKMAGLSSLDEQARKFERMAERFRARGE